METRQINKTKVTDLKLVDPRNIILVDGFNVRQDMGDLETLADSIQELGVEIPLKAKKVRGEDKWELVDGHRRMAAINLLLSKGIDIARIPVVPFVGNDEDKIISMIATGIGQKQLNEVEQSEAIKRLIKYGYKVEEISKKIGKSIPHVYNLSYLSNTSKQVKEFILNGKITPNTVIQIIKQTDDNEQQLKYIQKAIDNAENSGKKTATSKNVTGLKRKSPIQKLKELELYLDSNDISNEKTKLLYNLLINVNNKSVEELADLFS